MFMVNRDKGPAKGVIISSTLSGGIPSLYPVVKVKLFSLKKYSL